MENHHFDSTKLTISIVIFNSYVEIPEGMLSIYSVTQDVKMFTYYPFGMLFASGNMDIGTYYLNQRI